MLLSPDSPHEALNLRASTNELSAKKFSLLMFQATPYEKKSPNLYPEANLDDPSFLQVKLTTYLSKYE